MCLSKTKGVREEMRGAVNPGAQIYILLHICWDGQTHFLYLNVCGTTRLWWGEGGGFPGQNGIINLKHQTLDRRCSLTCAWKCIHVILYPFESNTHCAPSTLEPTCLCVMQSRPSLGDRDQRWSRSLSRSRSCSLSRECL